MCRWDIANSQITKDCISSPAVGNWHTETLAV